MSADPIHLLYETGQSIWCDQLGRKMIDDGSLRDMALNGGIKGITSNPTIFEKAIGQSDVYAGEIRRLAEAGMTAFDIYDELTVKEIQDAADIFRPVYDSTRGRDGYISLEVRPDLAYDTAATVAEAERLHRKVDRPNLMVKVPGTREGIPAVRELIFKGINVNVTLIFSVKVYAKVCAAFVDAILNRVSEGLEVDRIASVASFFVSRIDTAVDARLSELAEGDAGADRARLDALQGRAAVENARLAYVHFTSVFHTDAFRKSAAMPQRPLWASTSTKNPAYRDVMYVEQLIGPDTVNTAPPATIDAFRDHGRCARTVDRNPESSRAYFRDLADAGIDFDEVTAKLEEDGVKSFANSFSNLIAVIDSARGGRAN